MLRNGYDLNMKKLSQKDLFERIDTLMNLGLPIENIKVLEIGFWLVTKIPILLHRLYASLVLVPCIMH